ncbi:hypothetical protein SAMN05443637_111184 [Pseudonocardia thermophila]|jgi:Acyl-CoA synthetases (AMP-forming)/AMP-acid ligases II|uniref:Uncharacterized protein n=1 Tax=Pseudonocardia thermophila TaxID=1848 RepID=A0A1M6V482_PSETH|nr:hypothetical protein [Pseudonocardia thermophila]SHK76181.1 hypothetical protein SAMN05443637_111184 [Pseudonocardia thermophila]
MRSATCGGAHRPTSLVQRMEELGWEFCQICGMTETSPLLTTNRAEPGERARRLVSAAIPPVIW